MSGGRKKVVFSWSGGKDSAMALEELQRDPRYEVVALLTSIAAPYGRISHHGVREKLLDQQAAAIGIPLDKLYLPFKAGGPCANVEYEALMDAALIPHRDAGVVAVAHGDIFLEDLREYRERNLARLGLAGVFPIWKRDTRELMETFIERGFKAYISCVDGGKLGAGHVGRALDAGFIRDLPAGIDPCGEYGEYHSFVYDGPIFREPVAVRVGEIVSRDGRHYADLLPRESGVAVTPAPQMPPIR